MGNSTGNSSLPSLLNAGRQFHSPLRPCKHPLGVLQPCSSAVYWRRLGLLGLVHFMNGEVHGVGIKLPPTIVESVPRVPHLMLLSPVAGANGMGDKVQKSWENFLNPEVLRSNLIVASIYIAAFELLKNAIAERIRYFYTMGFDENGTPTGRKYRPEVLARNDSPVYASLAWLKESQAIDDNDEAVFERVKKLRNELAHALTRMLNIGGLASDLPERFNEMVSLLDKIERWWIVNLEAEAVDPENVIPGAIMGLHLMVGIALGPKEEWKSLFDEFVKRTTRRT